MIHHGEIVGPGEWSPVVDRETWEAAQAKMRRSTEAQRAGGWSVDAKGTPKHLLTGLAKCGICGATITTSYSAAGKRMVTCRASGCVGRQAQPVEELVVRVVLGLVERYGLAALPQDKGTDRAALVQEQATLQKRQEQLASELADTDMTPAQFRAMNARFTERMEEISNELAASADAADLRPLIDADDVQAAWDQLDLARRRAVILALVDVTVMPTTRGGRFRPEHIQITPKS